MLKKHHMSDLLNRSWVMVAGDSQARSFAAALLGLVLDSKESRRGCLVEGLFRHFQKCCHTNLSFLCLVDGLKKYC